MNNSNWYPIPISLLYDWLCLDFSDKYDYYESSIEEFLSTEQCEKLMNYYWSELTIEEQRNYVQKYIEHLNCQINEAKDWMSEFTLK